MVLDSHVVYCLVVLLPYSTTLAIKRGSANVFSDGGSRHVDMIVLHRYRRRYTYIRSICMRA